jgi:general secretion pathway protein K
MLFNDEQDEQWGRDGVEYEMMLDDRRLYVSLQDERGKIDLNHSPEALLQEVITRSDESVDAEAIAQSILDWRDEDQSSHDAGAEDDDYFRAQYHYGARDSAFLSVDELQQVMGMTTSLYNELSGVFTVYSRSKGVDPWTAPVAVLNHLPGMDEGLAQEFTASRQQAIDSKRNVLATDLPVEVQSYLAQAGAAVYTVTSRVQSQDGANVVASAVVHLTGNKDNPYTIIAWRYPYYQGINNGADRNG